MDEVRLLYIDEEDGLSKPLADLLGSKGFDVSVAESGKSGLKLFEKGTFDLVLCGLKMREPEGMEFLARIKEKERDIPFVVLTSRKTISSAVEAIRRGADDIVLKPPRIEEIVTAINEAMARRKSKGKSGEGATGLKREKFEVGGTESPAAAEAADRSVHAVIEASPVPTIISRREDGRIRFVNEQLARLVGLASEEMVGRHIRDFYYDPEDGRKVAEILDRDGCVSNFETRIKKKDGSYIWTVLSLVATEIAGERAVLGGLYDVSERKSFEETIEKERNFISAVLDTAGALIIVLDTKGRIVRFNRACEEITGYSLDEVKGTKFWEIFLVPDEMGMVTTRFEKLTSGVFPLKGENIWVTKRGDRRLIAWANTAILDHLGKIENVVAIGIDMTELRQAEEKIKLYRELFMNANDAVAVFDTKGYFIERNPAHKRYSDLPDDLEGKKLSEFYGERGAEIEKIVLTDGSFRGELSAMGKDGSERCRDLSIFSIRRESGEIISYAVIARDITERKLAEEAMAEANRHLKETQAQLAQSEKMASLGMLVAGIAHEINTPIGAVNSMHDTLVRSVGKLKGIIDEQIPKDTEQRSKLEKTLNVIDESNKVISSGTERVTNIVRKLRSFARLDEAELKTVDIHEGLEETLTLIHHELKHDITVIKNYGDVPPLACYPGQLNQVFLNILINARQAIRGKGEITLTTYTRDDKAYIAIEDNGVGISEEDLNRVFDPGFTTKGVGVGTGLGLSICYQIVRDHRGEIKVESELGKGTTFTIVLPMNLDKIIGN